ncbi:Spo0B domain-containing protein [Desulfofundulus thermosubterraneus]|uniref:Sensor_kinase_SpoOB-type, alpha-helical domain n=1 Tax=Desulfofundulus thermosubterraneus DSM 16057 TaxID=1121432 RepID=A0A1M6AKP6_9FIRM|nr:Spo0B domain-containing protein [Desulfofundulus thermosubterraneus]SHI37036.1 Sensor_kinase_SpoOB-type, alpha-helical domain [Desulfofundulus thermosubterraneus DSM 16057]
MGTGLAATLLHYGLFLYNFIIENVVFLALALTLNGYDIKQNWRRVLLVGTIFGIAGVVFFHLPQTFRIILLWVFFFWTIKFFFGFTIQKSVLVTFSVLTVALLAESTAFFILVYLIGVTPASYFASFKIRVICPLAYVIPLAILTYVSYRRRWRIFKETGRLNIPVGTFLPLLMQMFLIYIAVNEFFSAARFDASTQKLMALIFALLTISLFLSLFLTWRVLRFAEREAVVAAQEKLAEEMRWEIDILRGQRHDFINHVQIITALLSEGRKEELARYVKALKEGLLS